MEASGKDSHEQEWPCLHICCSSPFSRNYIFSLKFIQSFSTLHYATICDPTPSPHFDPYTHSVSYESQPYQKAKSLLSCNKKCDKSFIMIVDLHSDEETDLGRRLDTPTPDWPALALLYKWLAKHSNDNNQLLFQ